MTKKLRMNVLVTGGLGGLGREITEALAAPADHRVVTFSRSAPPDDHDLPENVLHETGSILDADRLAQVIRHHGITHAIHAAGARTRECEANPDAAREVNVTGTARVLEAVDRHASVKRLVFLSSAAVYGLVTESVQENHPLNPATPYARTKVEAENLIRQWAGRAHAEAVIVRPGFLVGPRAEGGLNDFLRRLSHEGSASLRFPERFHLHAARDIASGIVSMLHQPWPEPAAAYHLPGIDCSCDELAAALPSELNFQIEPDSAAPLPGRLDWTKYCQDFNPFEPTSLPALIRLFLRTVPRREGASILSPSCK